jgi:3-hydroxybutyryl-CoA dehydrogenase
MKVLVIANDELKEELLTGPVDDAVQLHWTNTINHIPPGHTFEACIDLLFENTAARIEWLNKLKAPLIVINSVITPLNDIQNDFIRINAWNTFLKRPLLEAAVANDALKPGAEELFSRLGKKTEWVPDITGFITPRVVASIINEAFFALEEGVSSKEEIDTAMKLGTNYPFGPFEWSARIGLPVVYELLKELAKKQERYEPATLLTKTALNL